MSRVADEGGWARRGHGPLDERCVQGAEVGEECRQHCMTR